MDTPGKTARMKRCTAQADASRTSFTETALSRLSRLWPESALPRKGWKSLLGLKRTDPAAPPLLQGHTLRESQSRGGGPGWKARASRVGPRGGWRGQRGNAQLRGREQTPFPSHATAGSRAPASLQVRLREHPCYLQPVPGAEGPPSSGVCREPSRTPSFPRLQLPAGALCAPESRAREAK